MEPERASSAPVNMVGSSSQAANPFARVLGGFAALATGELITKLIAALVAVYLARTLEAAGFGLIGFATALATYFVLAVDLGLDFLATREIARQPALAGAYARRLIALRLAAAVLATLAYLALALTLPAEGDATLTVALYGLLFLPYALTPKGVLLGLERRRPWAAAQVAGQILFGLGCLAFVRGPTDAWRVPAAQAVADMAQAAVVLLVLLPVVRAGGEIGQAMIATVRQALPFAWAQGMRILSYNFDVLLIYFVLGDAANGAYLAAYKIVLLFLGFGALYSMTLLPAIARHYPNDVAALPRFVATSLALTGGVVLPVAVGVAFLAEPALLLTAGPGYEAGVLPLRILMATVAITVLGGAFRNVLIGCNRQRDDLALVTAAALLNVGLNLVAIPRFGLAGAAVVTVCSELVVLVGGWLRVRRLVGPPPVARALAPAVVATAVMALALAALLAAVPWPAAAAAAGLIYLGVFALLGGVPEALRGLRER
ncbi:MAG: flippase [Chloroflexota bacterium]|nr:flippase [Dehalococcoidia bacterium]MDW8255122.1 flippase [Chloroflexota bacterium]